MARFGSSGFVRSTIEEASLMRFQSEEYSRASVTYSDMDLAFELQLNEALAASAASAGLLFEPAELHAVTGPDSMPAAGGDIAVALSVQSRELKKREQEVLDKEEAEMAARRSGVEMKQRWHDKAFAESISQMSDEEWESRGDEFEKPFVAEECDRHDKDFLCDTNQVCSLHFARTREDSGHVGMAWAVADAAGHVLIQQNRYLGYRVSTSEASYTALINGISYALSHGVKNIAAHGDSPVVANQVSGKWRTRSAVQAKFLGRVQDLVRQLDSFSVDFVPKNKNQYALGLAKKAVGRFLKEASSSGPAEPSDDCPICVERIRVVDFFQTKNCGHKFCLRCLTLQVETQVKANQVPVRCPQNCFEHIDLDQCQPFLSASLLEAYAKCLTEASIPESDRVYCPFPNCSALMSRDGLNAPVIGSSSRHPHAIAIGRLECMECHRHFCVECKVPWHTQMSCAAYQELPADRRDAEDYELYRLASHKNWQQCKKCRCMIELDQGCFHMTCRCGYEFCYTCGAEWKDKQATCKCKLWDEDNIIRDPLIDSDDEEYEEYELEEESEGSDRELGPNSGNEFGNMLYKTRICMHWQTGNCWQGDRCTFAHGVHELQPATRMY